MELVDKSLIETYSIKNTSPKFPIEKKYVNAFLNAMLNSTSLEELYEILKDEMQNGDAFILFNSLHKDARNLNQEPYRSIIAYSMLKKDIRLFELISASMFTGYVIEYHGTELYKNIVKTTDEAPIKYTDEDIYTDMSEGLIQIGFHNFYCDEPAEDGAGSEYQTLSELNSSLINFDYIITLTKPARVEVLLFQVPYCYLSGNSTEIYSAGIDRENPWFLCPFGDETSMEILNNMTDSEIFSTYSEVAAYDPVNNVDQPVDVTKTIERTEDAIIFSYDLRTRSYIVSDKEYIWSRITIYSNALDKTFIQEKAYNKDREYYEKYIPIMLRIKDNDPDGPCLALQIEYGVPTIGAMFYTRDKK